MLPMEPILTRPIVSGSWSRDLVLRIAITVLVLAVALIIAR